MKQKVNLFILFSTIASSFTTIFIPFILLKKGYFIKEILLFFILVYFYSILNLLVIKQIKSIKIYYIYPISFLLFIIFLYKINNYFLFSLTAYFYSLYMSLYFSFRNILSIENIKYKDKTKTKTSIYVVFNLIGLIIGILIGYFNVFSNKTSLVISSFIFMLLSALVVIKKYNFSYNKVHKFKTNTILFLFFDQLKYTIITFSSLYIYTSINSKIKYIVLVNILSYVSSIIFILIKKSKTINYYRVVILLSILFIIKFNTDSKNLLLVIVFFEGICRYVLENITLKKIYKDCFKKCLVEYSVLVELVKNIFRFLIMIIFYLLNFNLYQILIISSVLLAFTIFIKYDNI